jgi:hypothetical protein
MRTLSRRGLVQAGYVIFKEMTYNPEYFAIWTSEFVPRRSTVRDSRFLGTSVDDEIRDWLRRALDRRVEGDVRRWLHRMKLNGYRHARYDREWAPGELPYGWLRERAAVSFGAVSGSFTRSMRPHVRPWFDTAFRRSIERLLQSGEVEGIYERWEHVRSRKLIKAGMLCGVRRPI